MLGAGRGAQEGGVNYHDLSGEYHERSPARPCAQEEHLVTATVAAGPVILWQGRAGDHSSIDPERSVPLNRWSAESRGLGGVHR